MKSAACNCGHALSTHDLAEDCLALECPCRRFSEALHGPLGETPDGDIHDYSDHPDYPENAASGQGQARSAAISEVVLGSKVGDWIWRQLNAGRSVADVTRELAERVEEMEARRVAS